MSRISHRLILAFAALVWLVGAAVFPLAEPVVAATRPSFARDALSRVVAMPARRRPYRPSAAAQAAQRAAALRKAEQQTKAQVAAAESALKGIVVLGASAERKVGAAQLQIGNAASAVRQTRAAIESVEAQLRSIEEQLEEQQPDNSEFSKLALRWDAANEELQVTRQQVLESPEYRRDHKAALESTDRATELPRVRQEALSGNPAYQQAKAEFDRVDAECDAARMKLYTDDETWRSTSEELREARRELNKAEAAITGGGLHKAAATIDLKEAQRAATVVSAALQQSQARLKSIQSRLGKKPATSSKPSTSTK